MKLEVVILAYLMAVTTGRNVSLFCTKNVPRQLVPLEVCSQNYTDDGRLQLGCKVLLQTTPEQWFIRTDPEISTLDMVLLTDLPVTQLSPGDMPACVSLYSAHFKKWSYFPPSEFHEYHILGPFKIYSFLNYFISLDVNLEFDDPVQMAVVNCTDTLSDGECRFVPYNFRDTLFYKFVNDDVKFHNVTGLEFLFAIGLEWKAFSTRTKVLNVTFTEIVRTIPSELIEAISFVKIERLVFHKCNFQALGQNQLAHMRYLTTLDFYKTPISDVHDLAFDLIPDIRSLSFVNSKLKSIPNAIFSLKNLLSLDLSRSASSVRHPFLLASDSCTRNSSVRQLSLSSSALVSLHSHAFCDFPNLRTLDLTMCSLGSLNKNALYGLSKLEVLDLDHNRIASLSNNVFKSLTSLRVLKLNFNRISALPGMTIFRPLIHLDELHLENNIIQTLHTELFRNLPVQVLTLSNNYIMNWTNPIFSTMKNLRYLDMSTNRIYALDDIMYRDLSDVPMVGLCGNRWNCNSCYLKNIQDFLLRTEYDHCCSNCIVCEQPQTLANVSVLSVALNNPDCVPTDYYMVVAVPLILSAMFLSLLSYTIYRSRWYITYFLLYLRVSINGYRRFRAADQFEWNAFLSYHSSVSMWVKEALVPALEAPGMNFSICIADRDFVPGVTITENICRSIARSRKSLFLINQEFCQSRWCMFEVSLAQHRLFEEERDHQIVFLRKGTLNEDDISPTLSFLLRTRTYIVIPDDDATESTKDMFWLQLKAALQW